MQMKINKTLINRENPDFLVVYQSIGELSRTGSVFLKGILLP
jgi:hypothetical protein